MLSPSRRFLLLIGAGGYLATVPADFFRRNPNHWLANWDLVAKINRPRTEKLNNAAFGWARKYIDC